MSVSTTIVHETFTGWPSYHSPGKTKKSSTFSADSHNTRRYCRHLCRTKSKSLMMRFSIIRLLAITEVEQSSGLDDTWCEENEQLLFRDGL